MSMVKKRKKASSKRPKHNLTFNFGDRNLNDINSGDKLLSSKDAISSDINNLKSDDKDKNSIVMTKPLQTLDSIKNAQMKKIYEKPIQSDNQDITKKHKLDAKKIAFELLFWSGLVVVIISFILKLTSLLMAGIGIFLMIISLVIYAIPSRKTAQKNSLLSESNQDRKNIPLNKEIPKTKDLPNIIASDETNKKHFGFSFFHKGISKETPLSKQPIQIIKESPEEKLASGIAKKQKLKKIGLMTFFLLIFIAIIFLLYKFNMLASIYGISIIVMLLAVSFIALIQSKKKYKDSTKTGIVSKPSLEIEAKIKNLKVNETEIDLLLEYINAKKSVLITTVAHDFGYSLDKIEYFAKILESHNLVRIYYPAFGPASLKYIEPSKKENAK